MSLVVQTHASRDRVTFFFYGYDDHRDLNVLTHSFPTRRSSDLPGDDPRQVGVIVHSFGAAVACYAGAVEQRFACVISSCDWGNGERKFRGQHPDEMWDKFVTMLETAKLEKERTGKAPIVPRFDEIGRAHV